MALAKRYGLMVKNTTVPMRKVSKKVSELTTGQMGNNMLVNGQTGFSTDMALKNFLMVKSMLESGLKVLSKVMVFTRGQTVQNTRENGIMGTTMATVF